MTMDDAYEEQVAYAIDLGVRGLISVSSLNELTSTVFIEGDGHVSLQIRDATNLDELIARLNAWCTRHPGVLKGELSIGEFDPVKVDAELAAEEERERAREICGHDELSIRDTHRSL